MNLTTRGRVVAGIAVVTFVWAVTFRIHSLNAVVISAVVALGAGAIVVHRTGEPAIRRIQPDPGYVDEERSVSLSITIPGAPAATVTDHVPDGVIAVDDANRQERTLDGKVIEYRVIGTHRGVAELGPVSITVTDPFGLIEQHHELDATVEFTTYPHVYHLLDLETVPFVDTGGATRERHEFDRVREYHRGDPLRDIHWRSTAKHGNDELIVKEFMARTDAHQVLIYGEADAGGADAMATAVASLAVALMNDGIQVGVVLPGERLPIDVGDIHRHAILESLARTSGGSVALEAGEQSSILVRATGDIVDAQVIVGNRTIPFERLLPDGPELPSTPDTHPNPTTPEEASP